jgi:hypothetical protein
MLLNRVSSILPLLDVEIETQGLLQLGTSNSSFTLSCFHLDQMSMSFERILSVLDLEVETLCLLQT